MLQYQNMGKQLQYATKKVAEDTNSKEKPIVFSICEWGWNRPYKWGGTAGNLWRTTPDIRPEWLWMINYMYRHNVKLDKYASVGHWNDPDMLEVGNGKLTYDENVAHFSLWCMMASPLILGNDLRSITPEVLSIDGAVVPSDTSVVVVKGISATPLQPVVSIANAVITAHNLVLIFIFPPLIVCTGRGISPHCVGVFPLS